MNITIDIPGKPLPKSRPRMVNGRIWTPSTPHENAVATVMLKNRGAFAGEKNLSVSAWFYGADPRSDLDNLGKLVVDAAVKASVIDDDNIKVVVKQMFEARGVDDTDDGGPFDGKPGTRVRIGNWK